MVEHGSRLAGSQRNCQTRFNEVGKSSTKPYALAVKDKARDCIGKRHVDQAVQERRYRNNRIERDPGDDPGREDPGRYHAGP